MRAWQVVRHGRPSEALELRDVVAPSPGPGEVLVRAAASVCNYNEVDGCHGRYLTIDPPLPYTLGMELVGVVEAAGPGAEPWVGRRVMASATGAIGAHAELAVATAAMTFDAPSSLDDAEAAAFFFPFHLAHLGLFERGRLSSGETVLVHAAAGGVGSAAVQLAVAAGARVIATVGSAEKAAFVHGLGADVVIDYREGGFADRVLDATGDAGVDVCFDGVGGAVTTESFACLGPGGRHLVIGFASGIEAEEGPVTTGRTLCFGNFDVLGVILAYLPDEVRLPRSGVTAVPVPRFNPPRRSTGDAVHAHLLELLAAGRIRPLVQRVEPFEALPSALEALEDRRSTGRIVIGR